jgi:hypothetical protein
VNSLRIAEYLLSSFEERQSYHDEPGQARTSSSASPGGRINFLILVRVRKSLRAIAPREVPRILAISASLWSST